jgi:competence protein ComEC
MRPPVLLLTIAFGAGVWLGQTFALPPLPIALVGGLMVGAARLGPGWLAAATAAGAVVGAYSAVRQGTTCAAVWETGRQSVILRLGDKPGQSGVAVASVVHGTGGCGGDVRIRLEDANLPSGATLVAVGLHQGRGFYRVTHHRALDIPPPRRSRIRDAVAGRLERLYGRRAPVVEAMILGRKENLPVELRNQFVGSGLAHLLAISGLHVGIVAAWFGALLRPFLPVSRVWLCSTIATWAYVTLLGFPVSATRAALFLTIAAVSRLRERRPPTSAVIAVTVLVLLAVDPAVLGSVGAWLSVAAVWGTTAAGRVARTYRDRVDPLTSLVVSSVGATLATAPITAFVFGSVSPVGLLANLPAVPLASLAVPGLFLSLIGGQIVAGGAGLALAGVETVARLATAVPGGHISGDPGVPFALPWTATLLIVIWMLRGRPPLRTVRRRGVRLASAGAAVYAMGVVPPMGHAADGLLLHFLDVGQGDAIAIRTPRGRWILVDGGPRTRTYDAGRQVVLPFLRHHGVARLDAIIVSHGDADHLGGVPAVVSQMGPRLLIEPGQPLGTGLYLEHLREVDAAQTGWQAARAGDVLEIDSVRFEVLHPGVGWMRSQVDPNENSVVVRLSYGAFDALLTGDIGWPAESVLVRDLVPVEVLKVGHHGSAGGTRAEWLARARPQIAVISVGRDNRYGHPAPDVLARLEDAGITTFRTDRDGPVTIRSDGRYFQVVRDRPPRLWERLQCVFPMWLPSSASSSNRSACIPKPPANSPIFSTTSP